MSKFQLATQNGIQRLRETGQEFTAVMRRWGALIGDLARGLRSALNTAIGRRFSAVAI